MKVEVVIPTKNPGNYLFKIIESLLTQNLRPGRITVIDSGSTDGSLDFLSKLYATDGIRVLRIAPEEFGHGKTRNLPISTTSAEFLVYLTHDSVPASQDWLANLIYPFANNSQLAATFGPHLAFPSHGIFTAANLARHFANFAPGRIAKIDNVSLWNRDHSYRQNLHFLSNNNAAYRVSFLRKLPFPEVNFAEDQKWAVAALERGLSIGYASEAFVFHSHRYSISQRLKRGVDEGKSFRSDFGYGIIPNLLAFWQASKSAIQFANKVRSDASMSLLDASFIEEAVGSIFGNFGYWLGGHVSNGSKLSLLLSFDQDLRTGKRVGH